MVKLIELFNKNGKLEGTIIICSNCKKRLKCSFEMLNVFYDDHDLYDTVEASCHQYKEDPSWEGDDDFSFRLLEIAKKQA